ncbi:MAG: hypothetical protein K8I00_03765, partial [Candidatus Omnitrophica bacterium]|nr:hypothetical protein [Candidatus Omnitrophota bacterium]
MHTFTYKAYQGPGKIVQGTVEAETKDLAIRKVIQSGFTPVNVVLAKQNAATKKLKKENPVGLSLGLRGIRPRDIVV